MTERPSSEQVDIDGMVLTGTGIGAISHVRSSGVRGDVLEAVGLERVASAELVVQPGSPANDPARRAPAGLGAAVTVVVPEAPPDVGHVLLVEDGGAFRWVVPDGAGGSGRSRRSGQRPTTFTVRFGAGPVSTERGLLAPIVKRVIHALTFTLTDRAHGQLAGHFVGRWETEHRPARLRRFSPDDYRSPVARSLGMRDVTEMAARSAGPMLLLIHGANALTHTGFSELPLDLVDRLFERYGQRVLAFDHPTLSVDPKENCRQLLALLPTAVDVEFDVLCHSSGGLVARVLAERPHDLGIDSSHVSLRQVVFVGTPNRGTALADPEHLGAMVDGFTNLLDAIPDNPASPFIDTFSGIVGVVKQLAVGALTGLDGLMAMRPAASDPAGFLAQLNGSRDPGDPSEGAPLYRAISANYEPSPGSPLHRVVRDLSIDRLLAYEENDLIVPTASVYGWNGATPFPIPERLVLPASLSIDHSTYWRSGDVIDQLDTWLEPSDLRQPAASPRHRPAAARSDDGMEPDPLADVDERLAAGDLDGVRAVIRALPERHRHELESEVGELALDRFSRGATGPKAGRVFVLPGIMGSLLEVREPDGDADQIWISPLRLLRGEFARLHHHRVPGGPSAVEIHPAGLHRTYLPLVIGLDATWDVVPFAFDWRLGLEIAADALAERIDGPGHLVAHSMGGLVCRMLRARHRAAWDRLDDGGDRSVGGRLVMLGTPTLGSLSIATALAGEDKLVRWLARLDVVNELEDIRRVLASFPGVYQLLPSRDVDEPLHDPSQWASNQIDEPLLAEARRVAGELRDDGYDAERMLYIAGSGYRTATLVTVDAPGRFRYHVTRAGDGRVTHDAGLARDRSGRPQITKAWYSDADHGGLVKDRRVIAAVSELLLRGATAQLPTESPVFLRSVEERPELVSGEELDPPPLVDSAWVGGVSRSVATIASDDVRLTRDLVTEATRSWLGSPPLAQTPKPVLSVHVLHASMEHASNVVVVGHYAGTPLGGAEARADVLLHGRLSARQVFGRYPGQPNEVLRVAPTTPTDGRPFEVIVVGLGEMGELTPTRLTQGMRNAALEHALASAPPSVDGDVAAVVARLSTVIMGSYGPDGLQLATAISALVEGVLLANRELADTNTGRTVSIVELEIVELYEHRAENAARIVRDLDRYVPDAVRWGSAVQGAPHVRTGEGGLPAAPAAGYDAGMWRRLIVGVAAHEPAEQRAALTFTSLGVRARADLVRHVVDNRLLMRIVRNAVAASRVDGEVNAALFELLLPNDLKRELTAIENLVLVVDEEAAAIPWEALADRASLSGVEPLVKRIGLVRQLQLAERRPDSGVARPPRAMVIGDPPLGLPYVRLDGARREAAAVADQLERAGLAVERLIYPPEAKPASSTAGSIIGRLLAGDYQILHIAAHGWYQPPTDSDGQDAAWGGVVIGPGEYLTAVEIGQMRRPPDLVFLNCCHLGAIDSRTVEQAGTPSPTHPTDQDLAFQRRSRVELAASLSRTLMVMGVRAVVAAGWAVDDAAAARFATVFYERMLEGESFGPAVLDARRAAHDSDGGRSNTWAAYQCYGDPGFRIATRTDVRRHDAEPVSADDVIRALDTLAIRAGDAGVNLSIVREDIGRLAQAADTTWPDRGDVHAALGRVLSRCKDLPSAVSRYRRALAAAKGGVGIVAIEQLTNLEMRLAVQLGEASVMIDGKRWAAPALLKAAQRRAKMLAALPPTSERLAICASLSKALATRTSDAERAKHLMDAAQAYYRAWELDQHPYGANNALQLDGAGGLLTDEQRARLHKAVGEPDFLRPGDDFWSRIAAADLRLTMALVSRELPDSIDDVYRTYDRIFGERSSELDRDTAVRHTSELAELSPDRATSDALRRLSRRLASWAPS